MIGRPVLGLNYEHFTCHEYVLHQCYRPDESFDVGRTSHHRSTVIRQYHRRRNEQQNRVYVLCLPTMNFVVTLQTVRHPHSKHLYILPAGEHHSSTLQRHLEMRFFAAVGIIVEKVDVPESSGRHSRSATRTVGTAGCPCNYASKAANRCWYSSST